MIKIYTTPTCVYCDTLKKYLKERDFTFNEVDVSQNEAELKEMVKISGQMGVPVIDIDSQIIVGFDKVKIDRILGIKN
ncbi:MAG: glutaredoxin family protein [Candidatus Staskawiczbacteria bacterium]|nr:glutaredoxin family protein [Candidatus Staskawiczbacteria bacterium]